MFLAISNLTEFWDFNEDLLLLGDWCATNNYKVLKSCNYKVLPYPWENINEKYRAYNYCKIVYENIFPQVVQYLNEINGENKSDRYWRIVVGEWMWRYIHIIYDRYSTLLKAFEKYEDITTFVLSKNNYHYVKDNLEFLKRIGPYSNKCNDLYNLQIYSHILDLLRYNFPSVAENQNLKNYSFIDRSPKHILANMYRKCIDFAQELQIKYYKKPDLVYCGVLGELKAHIREACESLNINSMYLQTHLVNTKNFPINKKLRKRFTEFNPEDEFEKICLRMMEYSFPTNLLEGYEYLNKKVSLKFKPYPKYIFSAISWRFDTPSAYFIAEAVENGTALIGIQHGGGYGIQDCDPMLEYEYQVCDNFITWGWDEENYDKIIPLSVFKKNDESLGSNKNRVDDILMISTSIPRYVTIFQSAVQSTNYNEYCTWQESFISFLDSNIKEKLCYRYYLHDLGWNSKINKYVKNIKKDNLNIRLAKRIRKCRLIIIDHNSTSLLETVSLNTPTIIFWNMDICQIKDSAKLYFDELGKVGVFHESPHSAAEFVNNNYDKINEWWCNEDVQIAVGKFRNRYARTSDDVLKDWSNAISKIYNYK